MKPSKMSKIKKLMLDSLLSNELMTSRYKINAFYEWKNELQIFSLKFKSDKEIMLGINLNITAFSELGIYYSAYFISAYMHLLESVEGLQPSSYFNGLAALDAVIDIGGGRMVYAHSPVSNKQIKSLRPIDVYCAIRALARVKLEMGEKAEPALLVEIEKATDTLIEYTCLPEACYCGSSVPRYTSLVMLHGLLELVKSRPDLIGGYAFLSGFAELSFDKISFFEVFEKVKQSELFKGLLIRLFALCNNSPVTVRADSHKELCDCILKFKEDMLSCFKACNQSESKLLRDNLSAAKRLAGKLEQVISDNNAESGTVHFI